MRRIALNDNWSVRRKANRFAELIGEGAEWTPVTLPHDAMIGGERTPSARPADRVLPGRQLGVPAHPRRAGRRLRRGGAGVRGGLPRRGGVRERHHRRPPSLRLLELLVPVDHLLRHGAENEIRVEVPRAGGQPLVLRRGIYRNVVAAQVGRVHLAPDGAARAHPRDRRRPARRRGRRRRAQPVERTSCDPPSSSCSTPTARSSPATEAPVTTLPGRHGDRRHRLLVCRPATLGPRRPVSVHVPSDIAGRRRGRSTRSPPRSASGRWRWTRTRSAHQRRAGPAPRCLRPPRQRADRRGHDRPRRGAPGRAAEGRRLQRRSAARTTR